MNFFAMVLLVSVTFVDPTDVDCFEGGTFCPQDMTCDTTDETDRYCKCDDGFVQQQGACIDEATLKCSEGGTLCHQYSKCNKRMKRCKCNAGYISEGVDNCTAVGLVDCYQGGTKCVNGDKVCNYAVKSCQDPAVVKCAYGGTLCHQNATCHTTTASRTCKCDDGFVAQGVDKCTPGSKPTTEITPKSEATAGSKPTTEKTPKSEATMIMGLHQHFFNFVLVITMIFMF